MNCGINGWGVSWKWKSCKYGPKCIQSPSIATSFCAERGEVGVSFSYSVVAGPMGFGGNPIDDPNKGAIRGSY